VAPVVFGTLVCRPRGPVSASFLSWLLPVGASGSWLVTMVLLKQCLRFMPGEKCGLTAVACISWPDHRISPQPMCHSVNSGVRQGFIEIVNIEHQLPFRACNEAKVRAVNSE